MDKHSSRDERRARAMKIPFSNEKIINLPVEEFNELLAKHHLNEAQLALIRDIRRRGKNKMAAQNCRKRKLDAIINLEQGVQDLRRDKSRLLKEKMEFIRSIRQMKQKMQNLYQEVFSQLRDEEGRPYPPSEYSLQYSTDGSVLIMPRSMSATAEQNRKAEKKQKDKKKWRGREHTALYSVTLLKEKDFCKCKRGVLFSFEKMMVSRGTAFVDYSSCISFSLFILFHFFSWKKTLKQK